MIAKPPAKQDLPTDPRLRAGVEAERQLAFYLHRGLADDERVWVLNDVRLEDPEQTNPDGTPSVCQVDVQLRLHALPDGWEQRKIPVGTHGRLQVSAASRPDLVAMKVLAGRDQDIEDLQAMRVRQYDVEFVSEYLDSLEGKGTTPEQIEEARARFSNHSRCMIMNETIDSLISKWSSLGAEFNAAPHEPCDIDLERLILDTARRIPEMARLFIMAATWLHTYGDTIAKHRLKRLLDDELEPECQPILGLLLDTAQQGTHPREFESVIKHLFAGASPKPLFENFRSSDKLAELARRRASSLSRKWGLWAQPIEFKEDAIRPASWMMARHPALRTRADFRGDLRASILAALRHDPNAGESESRLAELAGGSRSQIRNAIDNLQMTGRVASRRVEGANRREIDLAEAA